MRVFAVTPLYPPNSRVGAWLATHRCLAALAARGHDVTVMTINAKADTYDLDGVTVTGFVKGFDLDRGARAADVVVSHAGDNAAAHLAALRHGRPSVRMVHGHRLDPLAVASAALVVFNSQHLADRHGPAVAAPHIVVRPPVFAEEHATTPGSAVTLVNLTHAKGGSLFWRLARVLPDVEFLGVLGGYGRQIRDRHPNVRIQPCTTNMAGDVWARTRVLLMPSEVETWGMVGVEALASGIPVIAHPTPGLLESLGPAGIFVDRDEPDGWLAEIARLADPTEWAEASARALARSAELDPQPDLGRFCSTVEGLTHHTGASRCA